MKTITFIFLIQITFVFQAQATHIEWLGGNGFWDISTNWSTGTVPTNVDSVSILNGKVAIPNGFAAEVESIYIESTGTLELKTSASLTIINQDVTPFINDGVVHNQETISLDVIRNIFTVIHGIVNNGNFLNDSGGTITIHDVEEDAFHVSVGGYLENRGTIQITDTYSGDGIENLGSINNASNAIIEIDLVNNDGINNRPNSTFENNGDITITNTFLYGIINEGAFINKNYIYVDDCGNHGLKNGSINRGHFENRVNGELIIQQAHNGIDNFHGFIKNEGIINVSSTSSVGIITTDTFINHAIIDVQDFVTAGFMTNTASVNVNYGDISLSNGTAAASTKGIVNNGSLINWLNSSITINNVSGRGISNTVLSTELNNKGDILITNTDLAGIYNLGLINNRPNGYLEIDGSSSVGLSIGGSGIFNNSGSILLEPGNTLGSIENAGVFTNESCADLTVHGLVDNIFNSSFTNMGFMVNEYTGTHTNAGVLENHFVLEDLHDAFDGVMFNQKVVVDTITGPLVVGQGHPNALELYNNTLGNVTVVGWYTDETMSTSAGIYSGATNTFTPDVVAVGLSRLYILFEYFDATNSCHHLMKVDITGGISLFNLNPLPNGGATIQQAQQYQRVNVQLYPNPASEQIQIQVLDKNKVLEDVHFFNIDGKKLTSFKGEGQQDVIIVIPPTGLLVYIMHNYVIRMGPEKAYGFQL